ncbi:hypothetical protein FF1_034379 [Malus domestica]
MTDLHANLEADANQVPKSRVLAFESKAEPDLSVTVNGLHMPNPFVIGLPPWTNYTVMKRAFDEGWGAAIAKTHSRNYRGLHSPQAYGSRVSYVRHCVYLKYAHLHIYFNL